MLETVLFARSGNPETPQNVHFVDFYENCFGWCARKYNLRLTKREFQSISKENAEEIFRKYEDENIGLSELILDKKSEKEAELEYAVYRNLGYVNAY